MTFVDFNRPNARVSVRNIESCSCVYTQTGDLFLTFRDLLPYPFIVFVVMVIG